MKIYVMYEKLRMGNYDYSFKIFLSLSKAQERIIELEKLNTEDQEYEYPIEEFETQDEPESVFTWISVNNELPEDAEMVLTFAKKLSDLNKNKGYYGFAAFSIGYGFLIPSSYHVTHWMRFSDPKEIQE